MNMGKFLSFPPAFEANGELVQIAQKAAAEIDEIQVVTGLIATGDSFMSDPKRVEAIKDKFVNLQAVEMEAAAIAQVAYQFGIPFVIIRALSDIAGKESDLSFEQFLEKAAINSATLVLKIVAAIAKS